MNELLFLILVPLTLLLVLRRKRTPDTEYVPRYPTTAKDVRGYGVPMRKEEGEPIRLPSMDEDGVGCRPKDNDR
mgnify:CR=1|tara:strand:+ start:1249 stop:1470 length:222 start_codon:yes stop_codon:yes gene_type:complete